MSKMIQIRNVPDTVHRKVKSKAAEEGLSMSDYLLREIQRLADRPSPADLKRMLAKMRPLELTETPEQMIRAMRDGR
jgi:plasmid stability protein